jgi:hypothetical protein
MDVKKYEPPLNVNELQVECGAEPIAVPSVMTTESEPLVVVVNSKSDSSPQVTPPEWDWI